MSARIVQFPAGFVRYSPIRYYTDLTTTNGRIIPLGVIAEFWEPGFCALGMIARTTLVDSERRVVGGLAKKLLTHPSKYLLKQFNEAWEQPEGESVPYLAEKHPYALNISPAQERRLGVSIPQRNPKFESFVTNFLIFQFDELLESIVKANTQVTMPYKPFIEKEKQRVA